MSIASLITSRFNASHCASPSKFFIPHSPGAFVTSSIEVIRTSCGKEVQALLRLEHVERMRATLLKISNRLNKELVPLKRVATT